MGRRKKEPRAVHRENIASAASVLFMENGITATSMSDIAEAAGYSKATLYVYFENKEEIIGLLVLESMQKLYGYIVAALEEQQTYSIRRNFRFILKWCWTKLMLILKIMITCQKRKLPIMWGKKSMKK